MERGFTEGGEGDQGWNGTIGRDCSRACGGPNCLAKPCPNGKCSSWNAQTRLAHQSALLLAPSHMGRQSGGLNDQTGDGRFREADSTPWRTADRHFSAKKARSSSGGANISGRFELSPVLTGQGGIVLNPSEWFLLYRALVQRLGSCTQAPSGSRLRINAPVRESASETSPTPDR